VLVGVLELDALAGERADARGIGVAAALVVGRDGVVILLEVDDGDLEVALAEPVGGVLLLGRAGGDADRGVGQVGDLGDLGLGAHHEGLALVEVDALEVHAERSVAREGDGGVARQQVDLARLQHRPALLHRGRRVLDLGGVAQHGGGERAAIVDVEPGPLTLVVGEGEARQAKMHAAFDMAARLDGIERRAGRKLLGKGRSASE